MKFKVPNRQFSRLYQRFLHHLAGSAVLVLTTTGRKSGKSHSVGLQYELIDGKYWVGAADGEKADWYRNLRALPNARIQAGPKRFTVTAELVDDPQRIMDFLTYRLKKRPLLLRIILHLGGLKGRITQEKLRAYAGNIRVVVFTPES